MPDHVLLIDAPAYARCNDADRKAARLAVSAAALRWTLAGVPPGSLALAVVFHADAIGVTPGELAAAIRSLDN